MIKKLVFILLLFNAVVVHGQMNFQDSTAQVISYWDLGEKYEYSVIFQKLKYSGEDTTSNETITYDVEVSVIDSSENSYTVRWFYKNFNSDSENPIIKKIATLAEDIAVEINLDEFGVIESVNNWEEVRDYMSASFDSMRNELPQIPEMDKMFQQLKGMYSSRASIEGTAIQDAQQFHNFHGGKFTLNEKVTGEIKTTNVYYPDKPFDTEVTVMLEALDKENNQYQIRSINEVNSEQLTETTYNYLKDMYKNLGQEFPKTKEISKLSNMVETVSIIHNTGWVIESVLWKEVVAEGITDMEIRTIQLK